jgi:hypothetical protein
LHARAAQLSQVAVPEATVMTSLKCGAGAVLREHGEVLYAEDGRRAAAGPRAPIPASLEQRERLLEKNTSEFG